MATVQTVKLNNGAHMPQLGLGVFRTNDGDEVIQAVKTAISTGYRSIDTASLYENETGVGQAIKESGVPREELFITTKVWNTEQGYDSTIQSFNDSLSRLDLDYVDLYLIHWPVKDKYKETWRALEHLYKEGRTKAIGVSNFNIHHLQDLMADSEIKPAVNQVEFHPLLHLKELLDFCQSEQIALTAWAPLMKGNLDDPILLELAEKHGKTPAQIVLRWEIQQGIIVIPKSITPSRIEENAQIFDFELSADDMARVSSMNKNQRFGQDPDNFNFD